MSTPVTIGTQNHDLDSE